MNREKAEDYCRALGQLKALYLQIELPSVIIFVTDIENLLMNVIKEVFPTSNHTFCTWNINNNVLANCKKSFNTKKAWKAFFSGWKSIMYASLDRKYCTLWNDFF